MKNYVLLGLLLGVLAFLVATEVTGANIGADYHHHHHKHNKTKNGTKDWEKNNGTKPWWKPGKKNHTKDWEKWLDKLKNNTDIQDFLESLFNGSKWLNKTGIGKRGSDDEEFDLEKFLEDIIGSLEGIGKRYINAYHHKHNKTKNGTKDWEKNNGTKPWWKPGKKNHTKDWDWEDWFDKFENNTELKEFLEKLFNGSKWWNKPEFIKRESGNFSNEDGWFDFNGTLGDNNSSWPNFDLDLDLDKLFNITNIFDHDNWWDSIFNNGSDWWNNSTAKDEWWWPIKDEDKRETEDFYHHHKHNGTKNGTKDWEKNNGTKPWWKPDGKKNGTKPWWKPDGKKNGTKDWEKNNGTKPWWKPGKKNHTKDWDWEDWFDKFENNTELKEFLEKLFNGSKWWSKPEVDKRGLSSLLNLLPKDTNILGSLGKLTEGTSLGTIMKVLDAINKINQFKDDLNKIPAFLNNTIDVIANQTADLAGSILHELSG